MAKNYYAVKEGRIVGIYKSWAGGAEDAVKGYSGAAFKGANTINECLEFLDRETAPIYKNFKDASQGKVEKQNEFTDSFEEDMLEKLVAPVKKSKTLLDVLKDKASK